MKYQTALALALTCLPASLVTADEPPAVVIEKLVIQNGELLVIEPKAQAEQAADAKEAEPKAEDAKETKEESKQEDKDAKPAEKESSEADLRKKMRELEQELQNARNKFQAQANQQRDKVKKDAAKALDDIKLPKDPTRKQCEAYVAELRKACEGRRSFSSSDPATKKLREIPADHFDLLITEMANRTSLRYYANYVLREIDPEKMRERFVRTLDENPNNIGVIMMQGWTQDVRPAIIKYMKTADGSISPSWFQAAVELDEPSLYPKLHEVTTQSRYASQFISMLEVLPDYDLAHTIDACWRRAKEGKLSINHTTFASKAASYGNIDALGSLVDQLRSSSSYMSPPSSYNVRRTNVLRLIDYRGSNKDIQKWYKDNKSKLVFDHLRKRFVFPEDF